MKKIVSMICLIAFINAFIPAFAATKVPAGTTIPISINQKITSKSVAPGASIKAKIDEDIIINNTLKCNYLSVKKIQESPLVNKQLI